ERQLRNLLSQYTGFPVHGEEYGTAMPGELPGEASEYNPGDKSADALDGPRRRRRELSDEKPETFWVVDPIDGTANYAVGNPFCCILVSLIHQGETLLSVTEMPSLGRPITAHKGHGPFVDGTPSRPMPPSDAGVTQISFASMLRQRRANLPLSHRQDMLNEIGKSYPRMRVTGSVGIDLA